MVEFAHQRSEIQYIKQIAGQIRCHQWIVQIRRRLQGIRHGYERGDQFRVVSCRMPFLVTRNKDGDLSPEVLRQCRVVSSQSAPKSDPFVREWRVYELRPVVG